jgi:hypothetical protein
LDVTAPSAAADSSTPDTPGEGQDLHCPLCEYNLRGLTEPRCPECGYRFEWDQLRDEKLKTHPYLFEHHPGRYAWSFRKTATAGLLPGRFWKTLHPGQPSRPRRLFAYWAVVMAVAFLAGVVAPMLAFAVLINAAFRAEVTRRNTVRPDGVVLYWSPTSGYTRTPPTLPGPFTAEGGLDEAVREVGIPYAAWWATAAVWPWMTIGALLIFRISMSRAKLKPIHVRRCVLYSFDACLWASLVVLALSALAFALGFGANRPRLRDDVAVWCLPVLWVVAVYRMGYAYQDYLRFDHAFQTVILSQIIVGLAAFIALGTILGMLEGR